MIVALKNPDQLPTGVIGLLASEQADETWAIAAWTNASYEEIILYLAENGQSVADIAVALGDLPLDWTLLNDPNVVGVVPSPFEDGLIEGDPLEPLVDESNDPLTTLEILEFLGYPAVSRISIAAPSTGGTLPIDPQPNDDCIQVNAGDWFDLLEAAFESEIAEAGSGWGVFDDLFAQVCLCWPRTWVTITSTPWSCGAWQMVSAPGDPVLGFCTWYYERIATKIDTRYIRERDIFCNITTCTQTRACASTQTGSCNTPAHPTIPPGGTCVGVPPCNPSPPCAPGNQIICNQWLPPC